MSGDTGFTSQGQGKEASESHSNIAAVAASSANGHNSGISDLTEPVMWYNEGCSAGGELTGAAPTGAVPVGAVLQRRAAVAKDAATALARWKAAMASPTASQNYSAGIQNTTVNPMAKAASADAQAKYAAATAAAVSSGRMARALQQADVNAWKQNASTVGAQRLASGAQKGAAKAAAAFQRLAPIWPQMRAAADAIPGVGLAAAQARAAAALAVMMQATGKA